MAEEIGNLVVSVGLDGTGFQNGISAINRQLRVVQSEFQAAAAQLGDFGDSVEALKLKADTLNKQIDLQRQKVELLERTFQQSVETKGRDAKATQELEIKLNKARAQLATMENELRQTNAAIEQQSSGWKKLSNDVSAAEGKLSRIHSMMEEFKATLAGALAGFGIGLGVEGLWDWLIKGNAEMEQYRQTLAIVLKDQQKAVETLQWAQQFAAQTPFEIPEIVEATTKLYAYGMAAKDVLGDIGDMAAAMGKPLMQAVEAVADAQTGELERLKEFGITKQMLIDQAAKMGKGEIVNAQGQITDLQALNEALIAIIRERYHGAMQAQSQTLNGMLSNLRDWLGTAGRTLGEGIFERVKPSIQGLLNYLNQLSASGKLEQWATSIGNAMNQFFDAVSATFRFLQQNWPIIEPILVGLTGAFAADKILDMAKAFREAGGAIGILTRAFQALNLTMLANPYVLAAAAIASAAFLIYQHWDQVKSFLVQTWNAIATTAKTVWNSIVGFFSGLWNGVVSGVTTAWNSVVAAIQTTWAGITGFFSGLWNGITTAAQNAWNGIVSVVSAAWNAIVSNIQAIWAVIGPIVMAGWESIKAIFVAVWQTIAMIVDEAWGVIKTIFATAFLAIYSIVTGNWDLLKQTFWAAWQNIISVFLNIEQGMKEIWGNAWEHITSATSQAWERLRTIFTNAWNVILQVVVNLWEDIKQAFSNASEAVQTAVSNMWAAIVAFFASAPGKIMGFVTSLWSGIQQAFINAAEAVKATVSSMWNAVVSFFAQAPGRIAAALQGLWVTITSTFRSMASDAESAGANVVQGFINGIWNLAAWAEQRIREFFGSAVQWAKKVLGIASPSKVFAEIGQNIVQGLAVGINDESATAIAAVTALANQIADQFETTSARVEAAQRELAEAQARLAEIQRQQQEEKDRQERVSLEQDIANAQARQQIVRQEIELLKQKLAAYEQQQKDTSSIRQEIARQEQQLTELQQTEAEKRQKLAEMETQAQIRAAQERVDALKKEQDALKQERDLLSQMQDTYSKYMSDMKAAWDDYQKKVSDVNAKLAADIQRANAELQKAIDDRAKALRDFVGLFDAVTPKEISGEQLLENLRGQVQTFEQWQENLQRLAARGIDRGLLDELRQMGPRAAAEVAALNTLTDAQLSEYVALWRRKNEDAKQEATVQLSDLAAQTQAKIAELRAQAAAQLEQYRQEWQQKTQQIHDDTIRKLEDLVKQASEKGFDMVARLAQAIEQALPQLSAAMANIPGLGSSTGGQDQVEQAQRQSAGIVQAAQAQRQGVVSANIEMFQAVIHTWTEGSAQIGARQDEIRTKTLTTWQQIQQQLNALWTKMLADLQKTWNDMKKFLFDTTDQVKTRFEGLVNAAQNWGVSLMSNFIAGIWSQFSRLQETLFTMAQMVDSYMPHSPAKVGPLRRLDEWGPALVQTFAEGIRSSLPSLEEVVSRMAALSPSALGPALAGTVSATTINNGGNTYIINVNASGYPGSVEEEVMRALRRLGVKP